MEISAADVKKLRDRTNAPMMDCKKALTEAHGDLEKAITLLREKNKNIAGAKAERETAEGRIAVSIDAAKKVGAIVEVRCESAPVAKSEQFVALANDLAKLAVTEGVDTVARLLALAKAVERINETVGLLRENMKPARLARLSGLLGSYVHHDGATGVLLQVEGASADPQLLRDVCMHVTAKNPLAARREDVPAETIAKETEIAKAQIAADPKNANKPANILEKIAEGKVKTWMAENILVEQPFVKDDSKTVGQLLQSAGLKLIKFVRYKLGELS
jgi:elongation factor Ts